MSILVDLGYYLSVKIPYNDGREVKQSKQLIQYRESKKTGPAFRNQAKQSARALKKTSELSSKIKTNFRRISNRDVFKDFNFVAAIKYYRPANEVLYMKRFSFNFKEGAEHNKPLSLPKSHLARKQECLRP